MPCTAGGTPVTIDVLLVLVVLGIEQSAVPTKPSRSNDFMVGKVPLAKPCSKYAGSKPSTTITTVGRRGVRQALPFTSTLVLAIRCSFRATVVTGLLQHSTIVCPLSSANCRSREKISYQIRQQVDLHIRAALWTLGVIHPTVINAP